MKRIRIPGIVDLVLSSDADEIEAFANDTKLDRAYSDRSILTNGLILQRVRSILQIGRKPFPTVAPKCAVGRAEAQNALWNRLNALAPAYSAGPDELESLAAFVRGAGPVEACGPLVQQVVGRLFAPNFSATQESWSAALVLDQAPRTMNLPLLAWWALTDRVNKAKQLLSTMVGGDLAGCACGWHRASQHRKRREPHATALQRCVQENRSIPGVGGRSMHFRAPDDPPAADSDR